MWQKTKKVLVYVLAVFGGLVVLALAANFLMGSRAGVLVNSGGVGKTALAPGASTSGGWGLDIKNPSSQKEQLAYDDNAPASNSDAGEGTLTQRKVVKDGTLSLLVKKADDTAKEIQLLAIKMDGFVGQSRVYEVASDIKSGVVTIRVPAAKFVEAMEAIKKMGVKVESENQTAQDVTEYFVDLQAQLKNFKAQEEQYLEIMKQAKTVEETLKVAAALTDVRGSIESIQGQLQYLSRQVDMSSITTNLTEQADVEVFGISWRPLYEVKKSFRSMLNGLASFANIAIALVFALPVILLWLVLIVLIVWVLWKLFRWIKRKFFADSRNL